MDKNELFDSISTSIDIDPDVDLVIDIDPEKIESESRIDAETMYHELRGMYFDDDFISKYPNLSRRLKQEVDALAILIKMRRSDEIIHEVNLKAIAKAPTNASLYRSLQGTQTSIIAIQNKIDDKISAISKLFKDQQLELNFAEELPEEEEDDGVKNTYRGSKSFIEDIRKEVR